MQTICWKRSRLLVGSYLFKKYDVNDGFKGDIIDVQLPTAATNPNLVQGKYTRSHSESDTFIFKRQNIEDTVL